MDLKPIGQPDENPKETKKETVFEELWRHIEELRAHVGLPPAKPKDAVSVD